MSAQGNINWPHGTRTIFYDKHDDNIEEESATFRFIDPLTSHEFTLTISGHGWNSAFATPLEVPQAYTQVQVTWGSFTSGVFDLGVDGQRVHLLVASGFGTDSVRVWDLDATFLGSTFLLNSSAQNLRFTIDGVPTVKAPGESIFVENPQNWVYPDNTDLMNWFGFQYQNQATSLQIEVLIAGVWTLYFSSFLFTPSTEFSVYSFGEGGVTGFDPIGYVGSSICLLTYSDAFLWDYFEPALPY